MPCVRVALVNCLIATDMCVAVAGPRAIASVNWAGQAATADAQERVSQWRTLGAHIIGRLSGRGGQVRPNARAPRLACTGSSGRVSGVRVLRCGAGRGADAHRLQRGLVDRLAQPPLAAVVSERVP